MLHQQNKQSACLFEIFFAWNLFFKLIITYCGSRTTLKHQDAPKTRRPFLKSGGFKMFNVCVWKHLYWLYALIKTTTTKKHSVLTYFPMLSGRTCSEISLMERHVRFRSSGKLSGNLEELTKSSWKEASYGHCSDSHFFCLIQKICVRQKASSLICLANRGGAPDIRHVSFELRLYSMGSPHWEYLVILHKHGLVRPFLPNIFLQRH